MAETFEAYRTRVLSYLGDEEPIGVQQATPSQLDRHLRDVAPEENAPQPPYVIHSDPGGMHLLEPNKFSDCDLKIVEDNHTKFHR